MEELSLERRKGRDLIHVHTQSGKQKYTKRKKENIHSLVGSNGFRPKKQNKLICIISVFEELV